MKFIDEAQIKVEAGKGGDGCLSFRREKFVPRGGPDGGDGGDGGSIFLKAEMGLNTLINFQYEHLFKAEKGSAGEGNNKTGKSGEDLYIPVPIGTLVYDEETQELLGDLSKENQILKIAQGGFHGLGNTRFKSSTNRAPRKTTKGSPGEIRFLKLELKILADVGLVGLPNAGKSTLLRAVSAAQPKVADYPFTTLHPHLGVVRIDHDSNFVMADIPGLIEGAAEGAGLGIQFLKHIMRTKLLLHLVDVMPMDGSDPIAAIKQIEMELEKFDPALMKKPRWLVFNKIDLLPDNERETYCQKIIDALQWKAPFFIISALANLGIKRLTYEIMMMISESRSKENKIS